MSDLEKSRISKPPAPGLTGEGPVARREFSALGTRSVRDLKSDAPGPGAGGVTPYGLGGSQQRPRRGDPKYLGHAGAFKHVTKTSGGFRTSL